jgi:hypothetical protein
LDTLDRRYRERGLAVRTTYLVCFILSVVAPYAMADVITFDRLPDGTPTYDLEPITDQYEAYGVLFSIVLPGTDEPVGPAYIAKEGEPATAFLGCKDEPDLPLTGQGLGPSFLTDRTELHGTHHDLLVRYLVPVAEMSGVLIDVDGATDGSCYDQWTISARGASGETLESVVINRPDTHNGCERDPGDAVGVPWAFQHQTPDISSVLLEYTGTCDATNIGIAFDNFSPASASAVEDEGVGSSAADGRSHPNPTEGITSIRYDLQAPGDVSFSIYDIAGRLLRRLNAGAANTGPHEVIWDGLDDSGKPVASGVYLARITTSKGSTTARVVVAR